MDAGRFCALVAVIVAKRAVGARASEPHGPRSGPTVASSGG